MKITTLHKEKPWNVGKRKPIVDDLGNKWCVCELPTLVSAMDGVHQAYCLKCKAYWYN